MSDDIRKDALMALRDKVKAGKGPPIYGRSDPCGLARGRMHLGSAFNGSLDAAKALHDAVLPGVSWGVGDARAGVYVAGGYLSVEADDNPARAWLLAILEALIAQEPA